MFGNRKRPLQIVVIGPPGAGKTSLIAAMTQCDQNGEQFHEYDLDFAQIVRSLPWHEADALILVTPVVLDADSRDFRAELDVIADRLRRWQALRGRRAEIDELPVFLVLSKCDLLANGNDKNLGEWQERLNELTQRVNRRLRSCYPAQIPESPLPFGRVRLQLFTTANPSPGGANSISADHQMQELCRANRNWAYRYRQLSRRSLRRVAFTYVFGLVFLAGIAALLALPRATAVTSQSDLQRKIDRYRLLEGGTTASRLREPLGSKIKMLTEFTRDAEFPSLPAETKSHVESRLNEVQEYRDYKVRLQVRPVSTAQCDRDLQEIATALQSRLELPHEDWKDTEAAELRHRELEDVQRLRSAVSKEAMAYARLASRADELWAQLAKSPPTTTAQPWMPWHRDWTKLIDESRMLVLNPKEMIPGSSSVTYATVLRFESLVASQREWHEKKARLSRVDDMAAALGLIAGELPVLLRIDAQLATVDHVSKRWQQFVEAYPQWQQWSIVDIPDGLRADLRKSADASFRHTLETGQQAILAQLQRFCTEDQETPQAWVQLRTWLPGPKELQDWNKLAGLLARLANPKADDPITVLAAFLFKDRFELELRKLTLHVPNELRLRPTGRLIVYQQSGEAPSPSSLAFSLAGEGEPTAREIRYSFSVDAGAAVTYRPGDALWAELTVTDADNREGKLVWSGSRSLTFQFERLLRAPRMQMGEEKNVLAGVYLTPTPELGIPPIPDLLPLVKLGMR